MNVQAIDVQPFLRGCAWPGAAKVPYPRADPADTGRLPMDTWAMAQIPVGVRLELVGDAEAIEIDYSCATADVGYRGEGAGTTFTGWRGDRLLDEQPATVGAATVRLTLDPAAADVVTVHIPEGMRPTLLRVRPIGGTIEPAPPRPRWLCYGDSIAEGWVASGPARTWPAISARRYGLDLVNLGYAGAARGEIVAAEQIAGLMADVITITYGTNCWGRIPHSVEQVRAGLAAFLTVVRQGHPETPVVVASPVVRPDAEATPNRLGASLGGIRAAMEYLVEQRIDKGDERLSLVSGEKLLGPEHLPDGIHPDDGGHAILAEAFGAPVAAAAAR